MVATKREPPVTAAAARAQTGSDASVRAYEQIREAIANLTFEPGQRLQEALLSEWLGLSRTPVREAQRRLHRDGQVESAGARGVVEAQVTIEDIEHAYLVLEVLEGLASRLAAQRLTDHGADTLRRALDEMRVASTAGNLERWATLDAALHDTIREIAACPKLSELAGLVYPIVDRVRNAYL
ncbi:MAG: GntR family transcriptional regulator, partial [Chloroflexota bacterium]